MDDYTKEKHKRFLSVEAYNKISELIQIFKQFVGSSDEPLDGDDVNTLVTTVYAQANLSEGNITDEEYRKLMNIDCPSVMIQEEFYG